MLKLILHYTICIIFLPVLLLMGCQSRQHNYQYYVLHPKQLEQAYKQCQATISNPMTASYHCQQVLNAAASVRVLAMELANDQAGFGQKLLHEQMQAAQLQQQLLKAKKMKDHKRVQTLTKQYEQLQMKINSRLAIISVLLVP